MVFVWSVSWLRKDALCQPPNKQLERTVVRQRGRAESAPFHCARAARGADGVSYRNVDVPFRPKVNGGVACAYETHGWSSRMWSGAAGSLA